MGEAVSMIAQALPRHKHFLKSNPVGASICAAIQGATSRVVVMGRPRKNGRLSCGSDQLGLDTKPRGKSVNDFYEKYAIQVSPQFASDRVVGRRKEQCDPNFSGAHVLRATL
jgi:hypothetical protein